MFASTTSRRRLTTAGWESRRRCRSSSPGSRRPTSCTCSASAIRSRRPRLHGLVSGGSRTSSSRSACSSRGCGRWRSSGRSTRRCTAAFRREPPRSSSPRAASGTSVVACGVHPGECTSAATGFHRRSRASPPTAQHSGSPRVHPSSSTSAGSPPERESSSCWPLYVHFPTRTSSSSGRTTGTVWPWAASACTSCPRRTARHGRTTASPTCSAFLRPARASAWSPPRPPPRERRS